MRTIRNKKKILNCLIKSTMCSIKMTLLFEKEKEIGEQIDRGREKKKG